MIYNSYPFYWAFPEIDSSLILAYLQVNMISESIQ